MYKVKLFNNIAPIGINTFDEQYDVSQTTENEDAILVRSANLFDLDYNPNLKSIARAGAGINNIDIETCTKKGIVVFNTPGANSNAVKELVFAGMLLASRDIYNGIKWTKSQKDNENLSKDVEKQKKQYAGYELAKKSLGVIGCGAIGIQVANLALRFDMDVHGYDPYMSVDAAWNLSRYVKHEKNIDDIYKNCDFITLHIPLNENTKGIINKDAINKMKPGVKILNFARGGLVNENDMLEALDTSKVSLYITDFPSAKLVGHDKVIPIPHLGASTEESEDNCAIMAAKQTMHYLQYGNIKNSVNMPEAIMDFNNKFRVCIIHKNVPKMISQITDIISKENVNIENLLNKSKKDIAYTMLDLDHEISASTIQDIKKINDVIRVLTYAGN